MIRLVCDHDKRQSQLAAQLLDADQDRAAAKATEDKLLVSVYGAVAMTHISGANRAAEAQQLARVQRDRGAIFGAVARQWGFI